MTQLSELSNPDDLLELGFTLLEQDTSDPERRVWYRKTIDSDQSNLRIMVEVEFELSIYDDPGVSYSENLNYTWQGCFIRLIDRQMDREDNRYYDEETEEPRIVGRLELKIQTLENLQAFIAEF